MSMTPHHRPRAAALARRLYPLAALFALLAAAGCGPSAAPPPAPTPTPTRPAAASPAPTATAVPAPAVAASPGPPPGRSVPSPPPAGGGGEQVTAPNPAAQAAVDAAVREATARLGVPAGQLRLGRVEARDWPDSSLGCPQPGMMYAQVITPGYLVEVAGGGKTLEYHTDRTGRRAVLCRET